MPILFACSAAASAASLLDLFPARGRASVAVHRFGAAAKVAEVALTVALERQVAAVPRVAAPLRTGVTGGLWRAAQGLLAASLVTSLIPGWHKRLRIFGALLGTAGAVALRFALLDGGRRSARDPVATFEQQRAGRGAREVPELESPRRHPESERSGAAASGEGGFELTDRGQHA